MRSAWPRTSCRSRRGSCSARRRCEGERAQDPLGAGAGGQGAGAARRALQRTGEAGHRSAREHGEAGAAAPRRRARGDGACPEAWSQEVKDRGNRRTLVGQVVSNKMDKTVVVRVERLVSDPTYKKYVRRYSKFMAHDETNAC